MSEKKLAAIKIADPKKGVGQEEYEAICKALGVKPKPEKLTTDGKALLWRNSPTCTSRSRT